MLTLQVSWSRMDGYVWHIRRGVVLVAAGTGRDMEDARRQGRAELVRWA